MEFCPFFSSISPSFYNFDVKVKCLKQKRKKINSPPFSAYTNYYFLLPHRLIAYLFSPFFLNPLPPTFISPPKQKTNLLKASSSAWTFGPRKAETCMTIFLSLKIAFVVVWQLCHYY